MAEKVKQITFDPQSARTKQIIPFLWLWLSSENELSYGEVVRRKFRPNFNCSYLRYQKPSSGQPPWPLVENASSGFPAGEVLWVAKFALLYPSLNHPTDSHYSLAQPWDGSNNVCAREPAMGTSSLSQQGLKKTSEEPALRFTSHRPTAAGTRPTERWFRYPFTLHISPSFAHDIGMCCTICFSEEEPGSNSSSLCVLSRARERGERDPWWARE